MRPVVPTPFIIRNCLDDSLVFEERQPHAPRLSSQGFMTFFPCVSKKKVTNILFIFFQLCEPVKKLPKCRFFRDMTWSLISNADNITEQIVHCHCPRGSVAYLIKRQAFQVNSGIGYKYSFACSPQSVSTQKFTT